MRKITGWYGNSVGHGLAAKGIRTKYYANKQLDPLFYANKHEEQVPFNEIMDDVRSGLSFDRMKLKYAHADQESLRKRGIQALDTRDGEDTVSVIDRNGVNEQVMMMQHNHDIRDRTIRALQNPQKMSFIHPIKVEALRKRTNDL